MAQATAEDHWRAVAASDLWEEHLRPVLEMLLTDAHQQAEAATDTNDLLRWQGYARGVRAVLTMPDLITRLHQDREESHETEREQRRPGRWVDRLARRRS